MLDYWLWRRERRLAWAATFWPATFFALPGILIAAHFVPAISNTFDGAALFGHGAAAAAGLGVGLAFSLHGVFRDARAEWFGFVLGVTLAGGAAATHWNADAAKAERVLIETRVVNGPVVPRRRPWFRARGLESIHVEWNGKPNEAIVTREQGPFREGEPVRLSVDEGRLGYRVIERVYRVEAHVR